MRTVRSAVLPVLAAAALAAGGSSALAAPAPVAPTVPTTASVVVKGAILARYVALGGSRSYLGSPLTDELSTPDRLGRYTVFQGGSIYWTGSTGAWDVAGPIRSAWGGLGWESSVAGFPTGAAVPLARGGAFQRFQGAQLYSQPQVGTHEVHGAIFDDWGALGWENGRLGYPTSNELRTPDRDGAFSEFERGAVYWSPDTGVAAEVEGLIREKWASLGWENSAFGFPLTDEQDVDGLPGGRDSEFEGGVVQWDPDGGILVTAALAEASGVDKDTRKITISDVGQSFTYDDNDTYFRWSDLDEEPQVIDQKDFERELAVGTLLIVGDYSRDASANAQFSLIDIPGVDPTAAAQLRRTLATQLRR